MQTEETTTHIRSAPPSTLAVAAADALANGRIDESEDNEYKRGGSEYLRRARPRPSEDAVEEEATTSIFPRRAEGGGGTDQTVGGGSGTHASGAAAAAVYDTSPATTTTTVATPALNRSPSKEDGQGSITPALNCSNLRPSPRRHHVDRDALSAFQLRTSISSIPFGKLWLSMQRTGWTHSFSTRTYRAPPPPMSSPKTTTASRISRRRRRQADPKDAELTHGREAAERTTEEAGVEASGTEVLSGKKLDGRRDGSDRDGSEPEEEGKGEGPMIGDSLAVVELLDRRSLVMMDDWCSPFPPPPRSKYALQALEENEEERRCRRWRDDLLKEYFLSVKSRESRSRVGGRKDAPRRDGRAFGGEVERAAQMEKQLFSIDDDNDDDDECVRGKAIVGTNCGSSRKKRKASAESIGSAYEPWEENGEGNGKECTSKRGRLKRSERTNKKYEAEEMTTVGNSTVHRNEDDAPEAEAALPPWPEPSECVEAVRSSTQLVGESLQSCEDVEVVRNRSRFDEWSFLLSSGYSLLLYGFGSKRAVLDAFARHDDAIRKSDTGTGCVGRIGGNDDDVVVVTVNGYDRTVTIDVVLKALVDRFLGGVEPSLSPACSGGRNGDGAPPSIRRAGAVARAIANLSAPRETEVGERTARRRRRQRRNLLTSSSSSTFFALLVLHNVDGPGLRNAEAQSALAALVSNGRSTIRVAASVDRIGASAMLWDIGTGMELSWVWREVHTFLPYLEEVRLGAAPTAKKVRFASSGSTDHGGILKVLISLSPRHTECLQALVILQRQCRSGSDVGGGSGKNKRSGDDGKVPYKEWKTRCTNEMKARGDKALREILGELTSHGIVEIGWDKSHGTELLFVPHSDAVLDSILNFKPGSALFLAE